MDNGNYLKLVALDVNGFEASIVDDKNVKNIVDACNYLHREYQRNKSTAVWLILPCSYIIRD